MQSLFASGNGASSTSLTGPGLQLDLSSTNANIVLGANLFSGHQSVAVAIGGKSTTFSAGASVTAAEYVAIKQVLAGGSQSLTLNDSGAAVGGSFSINSVASGHVSELVVPSGVVALDYANGSKGQSIVGDILNYGTIYGVATRGQGNLISLTAKDIVNESGGIISTKMSNAILSTLGGVSSAVNLTLSSVDDISNAGQIVSSGSLTLSTGSGNLTNSGLLSAAIGNININSPTAANNINVDGAGGTIQAVKGDINIRDVSYASAGNVNLNGGDYLSKNLNIYSGTGTITGNVGQLTGALNTVAGADHLQASTANLVLGKNTVADPTFVNYGGNIVISGLNTFSEDVALIAFGDITADSVGQIVDHGHDVTMIAGTLFSSQSSTGSPITVSGGSSTGLASGQVTVDTGLSNGYGVNSSNGGSIDLTGSKIVNVIDTSSDATHKDAGNVNLIAFGAIFGASAGNVKLAPTSNINASATGSGNGGNVLVIAGNENVNVPSTAIQLGSVHTGGGDAGGTGGSIGIYAALPTTNETTTPTPIVFGSNGSIVSGNKFAPTTPANYAPNGSANVTISGSLVTSSTDTSVVAAGTNGSNAGSINIETGGNLTTGAILAYGGGGAAGSSGSQSGGAGGNGGAVSLQADMDVKVNGQVNTSGGGGGGGAFAGAGGAGGNAGTITLQGALNSTALSLNTAGAVLAASGGQGGAGGGTGTGGGGASYGGAGGGSISGAGTSGDTIPVTTGGADVTLAVGLGANGFSTGGDIVGQAVSITSGYPGGLILHGNVVGTQSVTVNEPGSYNISEANANLSIITQSLTVNLGTLGGGGNIGTAALPIATNAKTVMITGSTKAATGSFYLSDSNASYAVDAGGLNAITTLNITSATTNSTATISSLPGAVTNLVVNVGSDSTTGGTIILPATVLVAGSSTGGGSIALAANNIGWTNSGGSALTLNADNSSGSGGSIALTTNQVLGSANINLGTASGQIAFSAQATGTTVTGPITAVSGGSISVLTPLSTGILNVSPGALNIGFSNAGSATGTNNGGKITLQAENVVTLGSATNVVLNASGLGSGNGGVISVITNDAVSQSISTGASGFQLVATNGSVATSNLVGGNVSWSNQSIGAHLTVDPTAIQVNTSTLSNYNGGSITLTSGTVQASAGGTLTLNVDGLGVGNGGSIAVTELSAAANAKLGAGGDFYFSAQSGLTGGNGGKVNFSTAGALTLTTNTGLVTGLNGSNSVSVGPLGTNGKGGSLILSANSFASNEGSVLMTFDVSGKGIGNGGLINVKLLNPDGNLTIGNAPGDMKFVANNGASGLTGGSVLVSIANNLTNTGAGVLTIDPSAISLTVATVSNPNVNGGQLQLIAPTIASAGSATLPLILSAIGSGTGGGGSVTYQESNASSNVIVGTKGGQLEINVSSGKTGNSVGSVNIISGGNLTVAPAGIIDKVLTTTSSGAHVTLSAQGLGTGNGNLLITGALSANGGTKGAGGTINLFSSSASAFNIGLAGTKNVNGVQGALSTSGLTPGSINLNAGGTGGITVQSALSTPDFITILSTGTGEVTINSALGGTKTSNITISGADIIGGSAGKLTASEVILTAVGGNSKSAGDIKGLLSGTTQKQLTIVATSLLANAVNDIDINVAIAATSTVQIVSMNAGGNINLTSGGGLTTAGFSSGIANVTMNAAALNTNAVVNSAPASTGSGTVNGGGNVSVTTNGLTQANITAGNTATVNLKAPKSSEVNVKARDANINTPNAKLAASGGTAGAAAALRTMASLRPNLVAIGPAIDITYSEDSAADVSIVSNNSLSITGTLGSSKANVLIHQNIAGDTISGAGTIIGKTVTLETIGGDIGSSGSALAINAVNLSVHTGASGDVYLNNVGKTLTTIGSSDAGSFSLTSAGALKTSDLTAYSGGISLTTPAASTLSGLFVAGQNADLTVTETKGLLTLASSVSASGNIIVTASGGINAGLASGAGLTAYQGTINVAATGNSKVSNLISALGTTVNDKTGTLSVTNITSTTPAALNIVSGGALTMGTVQNGGLVSITSTGAAVLTGITGSSIQINDKNKTTATGLMTTAGNLSVMNTGTGAVSLTTLTSNGGDVSITTGTGTTLVSGVNSAGQITVLSGGATTIGNLTTTGVWSSGSISVNNAKGLLQTTAGAQIYSHDGSILLENLDTKAGTILIGATSDIETGAKPSPGGIGGTIIITIGAPVQVISATPANITANPVSPGQIYFGKNGITAVAGKPGVNTVTAQGVSVIFSTGTLRATAIKLNGGVHIVADPPTTSSESSDPGSITLSPTPPTSIGAGTPIGGSLPIPTGTIININAPGSLLATPPGVICSSSTLIPFKLTGSANVPAIGSHVKPTSNIRPAFQRTTSDWSKTPSLVPFTSSNYVNGSQAISANLSNLAAIQPLVLNAQAGSMATINPLTGITLGAQSSVVAAGARSDSDMRWISESEIEGGAIPAVISSEDDLDIHSDVSSVLDMDEVGSDSGTAINAYGDGKAGPLVGGVVVNKQLLKRLRLNRGSVVFAPTTNTQVATAFGTVNIAAHSLVLVMALKDSVAVYDLNDTHKAAVSVNVEACESKDGDSRRFILAPGRHVLLTRAASSREGGFEHVNAAQLFAYRGIRKHTLGTAADGAKLHAYSADFNLMQAIKTVMPLQKLVASDNHAARKLSARLLKTTCILSQLDGSSQAYRQVLKPSLVASR
ncbi:MAG: hypothetical protein KGS72_24765 [Cyanobacteria bacterium REEB67]|nr:hypothetical protein [Cyanobacteria bacterium REEB67]